MSCPCPMRKVGKGNSGLFSIVDMVKDLKGDVVGGLFDGGLKSDVAVCLTRHVAEASDQSAEQLLAVAVSEEQEFAVHNQTVEDDLIGIGVIFTVILATQFGAREALGIELGQAQRDGDAGLVGILKRHAWMAIQRFLEGLAELPAQSGLIGLVADAFQTDGATS